MTHAGSAAAIVDDNGRLLLIKENYDRRRYSFPGGRIDAGESAEDAVVREVREETCVDARIDGKIGVYELVDGFVAHLFACSIVAGEPRIPPGDEIADVLWACPSEVPNPRSNLLHHALADVLDGARNVERRALPKIN